MAKKKKSAKKSIRWMIRSAVLFVLLAASIILNIYLLKEMKDVSPVSISAAESLAGLKFNSDKRNLMMGHVQSNFESYQAVRALQIGNEVPPAVAFSPLLPGEAVPEGESFLIREYKPVREAPADIEDIAFLSVSELSELIRNRKITSVQLTEMYLNRLKKYGPKLNCVITLTEDSARKQARQADEEIRSGYYRGPLHGIPYGIKDLLATRDHKTTWGAMPYKDQVIDQNAAVVEKLNEAGAVMAAKLSMGALAWGDWWFEGLTLNPWNPEEGSSGSSAGSSSATAAGLVGFTIGTETYGSIVSPSTRCRVTGLRPTFGMVSRTGAMALSWSMDKIGPIARSAEDCALVFDVIRGGDGKDLSVIDAPFQYDEREDVRNIKIGYYKSAFDDDTSNIEQHNLVLDTYRKLGVDLIPFEMPDFPVGALSFILNAEAAAAFDDLTLSGKDDLLTRQIFWSWPNVFRASRFIPAVEYIQANRARTLLMEKFEKAMEGIDVIITPSFGGDILLATNLTGHPCVVVPAGVNNENQPVSISFIGKRFGEGKALRAAKAFQDAAGFHKAVPDLTVFE